MGVQRNGWSDGIFDYLDICKKWDDVWFFGLHAGCDIDMHNYKMKNVEVENLSAGGYKAWMERFLSLQTSRATGMELLRGGEER